MIGVLIVAHGGLAREYLSAMEHIVGPNPGIITIGVLPTDDIQQREKQITDTVIKLDEGNGVIVVTDIHGSTPANLALKACKNQKVKIIFGANLPLLLKLVKVRKLSFELAVSLALDSGRKYIDVSDPCGSKDSSVKYD